MLLSISNSKARTLCKSWLLALIIAVLIIGALESFWRCNGHRPSIVDDQRLWAIERNKTGMSPKEIVLLGSSRMQTDISTATLRRLAPDYSIINLAADSTCANAALRDLAEDKNFKGILLVETTSECLMFGDEPRLSQQFYVDYFHKTYNLNVKLNRLISTFVQKSLTVVDPYLNLIKVASDLVNKKKLRIPNYLETYEDRSRTADYTKLDIQSHKTKHLNIIYAHHRQLSSRISTQLLTQQLAGLEDAINRIENRGGKVVFARFPVSDEQWESDEQYFPRHIYWDNLPNMTTAKVFHFRDIEGINKLRCPDTSHLDVRDTEAFTIQLFNVLHNERII